MVDFTVKLADLLFPVCGSDTARAFFEDYITDDTGGEPIRLTPEILDGERQFLRRINDPAADAPAPFLETLALFRIVAEQLPAYDRALFHGSSLAIDGRGVLFTAKSGTGKSTHTRLWREVFGERVVMINDDKPFLHITPEGTRIFGTPWRGKHRLGSNISAPLGAICIVCRGAENRIQRVTPREALPTLLQQIYMPKEPRMLRQTLALADRLAKTVPVYRLRCNMDPEAALVAYGGLEFDEKKAGTL